MQTVILNIPYKGDRDYLHGTDMYAETVRELNDVHPEHLTGQCRLMIHKIARHQCQLQFSRSQELSKRPEDLIAEFIFTSSAGNLTAWLVETDIPITGRNKYAETLITEKCRLVDQSIKLSDKTGFSAIEELVAMNKMLHNAKYPLDKSQWYFTRLDLTRLLSEDDTGNYQVILQKNFNNRLTRSEVLSHDQAIGYIYFSMVMM